MARKVLDPLLSQNPSWGEKSKTGRIYTWLCGAVHLDFRALQAPPNTVHTFAAFAYTAWLIGTIFEIVSGRRGAVPFPELPPGLPWDADVA